MLVGFGCGTGVEIPDVVEVIENPPTSAPEVQWQFPTSDGDARFSNVGERWAITARGSQYYRSGAGEVCHYYDVDAGTFEYCLAHALPAVQGDLYYNRSAWYRIPFWIQTWTDFGPWRGRFRFQNQHGTSGWEARDFVMLEAPPGPNFVPAGQDRKPFPETPSVELPPCQDFPDQPHCGGGGGTPNPYPRPPRAYYLDWDGPFYAGVDSDGNISNDDLEDMADQQSQAAYDYAAAFAEEVYGVEVEDLNQPKFLAGLEYLRNVVDLSERTEPGDITTGELLAGLEESYIESREKDAGSTGKVEGGEMSAAVTGNEAERDAVVFAVYPNPTVSDATIRVPARAGETASVSVYTIHGRQVYANEARAANDSGIDFRWIVDESIAPGTYLIRADVDSRHYTSTIVVM